MTVQNENGELRQLLEIKRAYRRDLTSLEEEVKARFDRELLDGKKRLKEQYLENVVDAVFGETAPAEMKTVAVEPGAPAEPKPPACPECGGAVDPNDKFCARCAFPLKEDEKPVAVAGRKLRTGSR